MNLRHTCTLRLLSVPSLAEEVYGSREEALRWLRQPTPRLKNRAPVDLLNTGDGGRMVEELLTQIDEGMFV